MAIEYRGEKFSGYNKPKRTPKHKTKSHAVLARYKGVIKLVRFGAEGAKSYPPKDGGSARDKAMRAAWYARHEKNLRNATPLDLVYWAAKVQW